MRRYKILHRTYYNFSSPVLLNPQTLRIRPLESHELRIESSLLDITPTPVNLRWHRDVEDNSVAIATFNTHTQQLLIESVIIIQQYNIQPLDFIVADYAVDYPFLYQPDDVPVLLPYLSGPQYSPGQQLNEWISTLYQPDTPIQTYSLLQHVNLSIYQKLKYQIREEPGVQSPEETLAHGTGSCRDSALLFIAAVRQLGFAARFVSGYLHASPSDENYGATHAWAEVFLPGAGWKGFDPTIGEVVGTNHTPVAVARLPELVPPIAGSFSGSATTNLEVGVWVTEMD
jgi:transglutaminase-like putative cysteine protease